MSNRYQPEVGSWFKDVTGASFEVIFVDEDTVEVQYDDGSLEAFDFEVWNDMELTRRAPPEDWSDLGVDEAVDEEEPVELDMWDSDRGVVGYED